MDFNLKNQQAIQPTDVEFTTGSQKLSYSSPVLQVFGSVRTLTQGGGASGTDSAFKLKN